MILILIISLVVINGSVSRIRSSGSGTRQLRVYCKFVRVAITIYFCREAGTCTSWEYGIVVIQFK